ncbi:MAG: hypothetical protein FWC40_00725, partial [Proteobacteria bacterium]|nr:hypothetical protein [Pseudomonadota bacterium]
GERDTRLPPKRGLNRRPRNAPLRGNQFPRTPCDAVASLWDVNDYLWMTRVAPLTILFPNENL